MWVFAVPSSVHGHSMTAQKSWTNMRNSTTRAVWNFCFHSQIYFFSFSFSFWFRFFFNLSSSIMLNYEYKKLSIPKEKKKKRREYITLFNFLILHLCESLYISHWVHFSIQPRFATAWNSSKMVTVKNDKCFMTSAPFS